METREERKKKKIYIYIYIYHEFIELHHVSEPDTFTSQKVSEIGTVG